ncbi:UDP-N-acetyl-D-mannosaminuronic acid dehydrogenase [Microbacterium sp. Leaf288]|uniref:UDP-N-acetyl-D-mannosamine dehydrogenase n=1 Tax=Microbacterium sp. Leaf288 TaxID=1736323 RepID=UPI0006FD86CD|nr:UDP-N-acetyl-D-mannosamine dehydrogenase [Microbacterium sp. Leaf288]KQP73837.1 UDP-N-acetyl-D-mannosaminuronic acid dehydrogenase [Microbacterium sp. Leaf288]
MPSFNGTVAVVGMGYIGLPTAVMLAAQGTQVIGVDVNQRTVEMVARGELPFVEPDLETSLSGVVARGRLTATTEMPEADAYIIAVPTPFQPDHTADLGYVQAAVADVAPRLHPGAIVVIESTSPPGTTQTVTEWLAELRPDLKLPSEGESQPDVFVAHCPERVLPGSIMVEMVLNDRVIGGITQQCAEKAAEIYRVFCQGEIQLCDAASAEMAKLVENAYRDVNIAFANELSMICDQVGLDVWEVIKMANHHPRVNILKPGPGVGGHCIAVDPWFIVGAAPGLAKLIRTAREVNDSKPEFVVDHVVRSVSRFRQPEVACLGLTFKANVDDLRESPAVDIVQLLASRLPDVTINVADPMVTGLPSRLTGIPNIQFVRPATAVAQSDVVLLLVDHDAFRSISRPMLEGKVVFDTRGYWR